MENNDHEIQAVNLFNKYLIDNNTNAIAIKFSIKYFQKTLFKYLFFCFKNWYKVYYLKVTYTDGNIKYFKLSFDEKETLKPNIQIVNFYLGKLERDIFDNIKNLQRNNE